MTERAEVRGCLRTYRVADRGILGSGGAPGLTRRGFISIGSRSLLVLAAAIVTSARVLADDDEPNQPCSSKNVCSATRQNTCEKGSNNACTGVNECSGISSNTCASGASNECGSGSGGANDCSGGSSSNSCTGSGTQNNCYGSGTMNHCHGGSADLCDGSGTENSCVAGASNACDGGGAGNKCQGDQRISVARLAQIRATIQRRTSATGGRRMCAHL